MKKQGNTKVYISLLLVFLCACSFNTKAFSQAILQYPPYTKWYQDALGFKPLELSTAPGFIWGAAVVSACLLFTKNDKAFQKNVSFFSETGPGFGYKPPYTTALQNNIGVMYNVRRWIKVGYGFNISHYKDRMNNTFAFGITPFARWYPYRSKVINLFFEYGAGFSYSPDKFPLTGTGWEADTARTGTRFNFTSKYSIGAEIRINNRFLFQGGLRHFHLSNGNLAGIERNPSYDNNGFFAGFIYYTKSIAKKNCK